MKKAFIGAVAILTGFKLFDYQNEITVIFGIMSFIAGVYILIKEYLEEEKNLQLNNESNYKNTDVQ